MLAAAQIIGPVHAAPVDQQKRRTSPDFVTVLEDTVSHSRRGCALLRTDSVRLYAAPIQHC